MCATLGLRPNGVGRVECVFVYHMCVFLLHENLVLAGAGEYSTYHLSVLFARHWLSSTRIMSIFPFWGGGWHDFLAITRSSINRVVYPFRKQSMTVSSFE